MFYWAQQSRTTEVYSQVAINNIKAVLVRGLPNTIEEMKSNNENLKKFNHKSTEDFLIYFQSSKTIFCLAGYSSIMDLATLKKKAILGQHQDKQNKNI
jgi:thioredoxin-related protein